MEPQRLMVGLFRLGVASNTAGIISKKMFDRPPRGARDPRETLFGTVPFYAPKSVSLKKKLIGMVLVPFFFYIQGLGCMAPGGEGRGGRVGEAC